MDLMWVDYIDSPIQPFRDLMEQGAGRPSASVGVSGYYEVKQVVIRHGGPTVVCTPGWGGSAGGRPGLDPATFATELGILALRGFSDMKEKARDLMVRNKFIASQQSCDLRRHLDSAALILILLNVLRPLFCALTLG